jgi:hypothetical protein
VRIELLVVAEHRERMRMLRELDRVPARPPASRLGLHAIEPEQRATVIAERGSK